VQQGSGPPARLCTKHWMPTDVVAQLKASLRALSTDHLDIYQMHSGSDEVVQNDWN
jgi:aryl-alcohol dehydrogenase-like predicted oxidoreductase